MVPRNNGRRKDRRAQESRPERLLVYPDSPTHSASPPVFRSSRWRSVRPSVRAIASDSSGPQSAFVPSSACLAPSSNRAIWPTRADPSVAWATTFVVGCSGRGTGDDAGVLQAGRRRSNRAACGLFVLREWSPSVMRSSVLDINRGHQESARTDPLKLQRRFLWNR